MKYCVLPDPYAGVPEVLGAGCARLLIRCVISSYGLQYVWESFPCVDRASPGGLNSLPYIQCHNILIKTPHLIPGMAPSPW